MRFSLLGLCLVATLLPAVAKAEVVFQPPACDFKAVFVAAPDQQVATVPLGNGVIGKSDIATWQGTIDGVPNIFRAECSTLPWPVTLDAKLMLEDMETVAQGNNLKNIKVWTETNDVTRLVGRARGEIQIGTTNYEIDIYRFFSEKSMLDAWVGAAKQEFPTLGNHVFLKELRMDGKQIY